MNKIFLLAVFFLISLPYVLATTISTDDFECNGFNCGSGWDSAWSYGGACEIVTLSSPIGSYHMRGYNNCNAIRRFDDTGYSEVLVSFYATATSLENNEYCYYYYNDGSSDHLLLSLTNGDDDGEHDYYEFDVTSYGLDSNAGLKMVGAFGTGDYCYIDSISISGTISNELNVFVENYNLGDTEIIELSTSVTNTLHTIELYDSSNNKFCNKTMMSPSSPFTSFYATCTMLSTQQINAYAKLYLTDNPSVLTTEYFNITPVIQDDSMLKIKKVYFSPQVLQGGSTEVFALLQRDGSITIDSATLTLVFPDLTQRVLSMSSTINSNEYRGFITDTYLVGNITFVVRIEGDGYYDTYTNKYYVAGYNIDFVDVVNRVSEVDVCKRVDDISEDTVHMHGTEYISEEPVKVWLQLLNGSNQYIDDAVCYLWVYNPIGGSFIRRANMIHYENGIYSYDFDAPYIGGVYPAISQCFFSAFQLYRYVTGFTPIVYSSVTYDYTYTYALDTYDHQIKETTGGGNKRVAMQYNFSNVCNNSNPDLLTGITLTMNVKWQSATDDILNIWWWNWTSDRWVKFPNYINYWTDRLYVSNSLESNNLSRDGITDTNGKFKIYINDTDNTDTGATIFYNDYMYVTCDELADPEWSELKGSSEVHVALDETAISGFLLEETDIDLVNDTTYEGLININFTVFSRTLEPTDIILRYELPYEMSCEDINYFKVLLDNGTWMTYYYGHIDPYFVCHLHDNNIVDIEWSRNINFEDIHYYQISLINKFRGYTIKYETNINYYYVDMSNMCINYLYANDFVPLPSIPLTSKVDYNDNFANGCAYFWHTYYYFNNSVKEMYELENVVNDYDTFSLYEDHYYRTKKLYDLMVNDFIIGGESMLLFALYSENSGSHPYNFWANYSSTHMINQFLRLNMSEYVWNWNARQLTDDSNLWIGGTEYDIQEGTGKIVVRMTDNAGDPVVGANCSYGIFYPNNTAYIYNVSMIEHTGGVMDGIYYADFALAVNVTGVFPYGVDCYKGGKDYFFLDTFHVRDIANEIWNDENRTLTSFSFEINATATINNTELAGYIWDYYNRTLTELNYQINATVDINYTAIAENVWSWEGSIADNILDKIAEYMFRFLGIKAEVLT